MQFNNVTPNQFAALKSKLISTHQADIAASVDGSTGKITGHGVEANFLYDAGSQSLNVEVIHHPFYISQSMIESQLRTALATA